MKELSIEQLVAGHCIGTITEWDVPKESRNIRFAHVANKSARSIATGNLELGDGNTFDLKKSEIDNILKLYNEGISADKISTMVKKSLIEVEYAIEEFANASVGMSLARQVLSNLDFSDEKATAKDTTVAIGNDVVDSLSGKLNKVLNRV